MALSTARVQAGVVFTEIGGTQRPTSITGVNAGGTTYDFAITYNTSGNSLPAGIVPAADSAAVVAAVVAVLNTESTAQNVDSMITGIRILAPTHDGTGDIEANGNVFDIALGVGNWNSNNINQSFTDLITTHHGYATGTLTVPPPAPVPEPSTLALGCLLGLGCLSRRFSRRKGADK
jgi:hypothetical protein